MTRVGVVGHVEWAEFAPVARVPAPGEIAHCKESWSETAGGGAVAAVQLVKLAGACQFFTALADDELGRESARQLTAHGVEVHAAERPAPQRRAFVHLDSDGERTITVIGERMVARGNEALPWERIGELDAVYFTGGDADALRAARSARVLVATPRAATTLVEAGVQLDVLVRSGHDPGEALDAEALDPAPRHIISTLGAQGGRWIGAEGSTGTWESAPLPGPVADAYGCGDSFAAGLTFALGRGDSIEEAVSLAARCGASNLTGRGPYVGQLRLV